MCSQLYGPGTERGAGTEEEEGGEEEGVGGRQRLLGAPARDGNEAAAAPARSPNPHASVGAFSIFQLVQNLGSALWYGVSVWLPVHSDPTKGLTGTFAQIWVQLALLVAVVASFAAVDRRTR